MASLPAFRVIERARVSPPPGGVSESTLPLSFFDLAWVNAGAVERVIFYHLPHSTSYFFDSILHDIKSSLSLALQQFYPLAGKICHPFDKYEIHYADGDSVPFRVAEYEADFEDISSSHARDIDVLRPLVPQQPKSDAGRVPLLALQVTVFPNQGAAIGVAVHHAACDGLSSIRFMSCWASTCAQALSCRELLVPH
ncbi:hypothetical protein BHM03_00055132 [Ensete ventricosum]|uniref:Uncharacterized protein n=1 Tax=Ensete ventricosum TaxID=4639 RepID=A0A445MM74_ENSVE|nr:hypothetical protein BHM03_00055132 [Ensete ventricosum]